ncbi:trypsin-like peptidase domain-containing protein [Georgenia wutianyii]|uniref:trypsin-like peptidase domain-containing protein n=1 Tax=Georgenia wutianyii TaxID=2585135 RepID=UPI001CB72510|nr:trypsin-like peptidase domain-containing protein [Georgenia wutianyii]
MDERPGEQEPGYPPAPAPRTEPYSVDDEREPVDDAALEDDDPQDAAPEAPAGPALASRDDAAPRQRRRLGWRSRRGAHRPGATPPPAEGFPWAAPADAAAQQPAAGAQDPWPPAGGQPAEHGSWAPRPEETPAPQHPAAPWPGDAPGAEQQGAQQPASEPWPRTGSALPWSSPAGGGTPEEGAPTDATTVHPTTVHPTADHPTPAHPAAAAPDGTQHAAQAGPWQASQQWQAPGQPWHGPGQWPAGPEGAGRRRRRGTVGTGVVVLLVLVALLGGVVLGALGARALWPAQTSGALPLPSSPTSTDRAPESIAGIAAAALDSTVFIEVVSGTSASSGSGMVLREDGYLVTNNHVIAAAADGGGRVAVTFIDGTQEPAEIVGRTADYDLAVLKVDLDGLTPLPLADSDSLVVGDPVVAVGAPLGLEGTVTSGIISALNRPVQAGGDSGGTSFINAIQTDAAINPGNSGGPLLNTAGEVIGINTAIAQAGGRQTGSIGLGFAIPSNQVRRTAEQIIETGRATYPVIGVALDTRYTGEGVQVLQDGAADTPAVTPGGPGDEAGIEPGDIITHFDGQPVTTPSELIVAVRSRAPGDTVVLTVRTEDGQEREVEVVLDEADSG